MFSLRRRSKERTTAFCDFSIDLRRKRLTFVVAVLVMVPLDLDARGGSCGGETASSNLR